MMNHSARIWYEEVTLKYSLINLQINFSMKFLLKRAIGSSICGEEVVWFFRNTQQNHATSSIFFFSSPMLHKKDGRLKMREENNLMLSLKGKLIFKTTWPLWEQMKISRWESNLDIFWACASTQKYISCPDIRVYSYLARRKMSAFCSLCCLWQRNPSSHLPLWPQWTCWLHRLVVGLPAHRPNSFSFSCQIRLDHWSIEPW